MTKSAAMAFLDFTSGLNSKYQAILAELISTNDVETLEDMEKAIEVVKDMIQDEAIED